MHILITSDTVGGVWTYTQELVTGLVRAGHRVTLVSFGKLPLPHQTAWMQTLPRLDYRPTDYRLEWMEVSGRDMEESRSYLALLIAEVAPDLLHFSQYCYGSLDVNIPKIVVAHSDIVSWWVAVHGCEPEDTPWMRNYRRMVSDGLRGADIVVAPSRWMLDQVSQHYCEPAAGLVIHNGRNPALFDPTRQKEDFVLSVGRVWDPAKSIALLLEREQESRICVVGWEREPGREDRARALRVPRNMELLGPKSQDDLRELYAHAGIYAGTSRYEPFGLAPLEAALSRCALTLNDNPVFHELWGDAGVFFAKNDSEDLADKIAALQADSRLREHYANCAYELAHERFTASRMVEQYEHAYQEISSIARVA
ncbi:MAG TPA: glycosyltransferase family 4 protein [Terriglobales bacterium]|nr:glycosyltransferase family 4 protein [Terriglobales bacterium]